MERWQGLFRHVTIVARLSPQWTVTSMLLWLLVRTTQIRHWRLFSRLVLRLSKRVIAVVGWAITPVEQCLHRLFLVSVSSVLNLLKYFVIRSLQLLFQLLNGFLQVAIFPLKFVYNLFPAVSFSVSQSSLL